MSHSLKELVRLLEIRTMSSFERRKRRLQCIPLDVVPEALNRARNGLPLTPEQYMASHLGFLPGEREGIERWEAKAILSIPGDLPGTPDR
jgi:hypothetical protein